jgi:hypothetical protein
MIGPIGQDQAQVDDRDEDRHYREEVIHQEGAAIDAVIKSGEIGGAIPIRLERIGGDGWRG